MRRTTERELAERLDALNAARDAWDDIVVRAYQEGNSLSAIARAAGTNHVRIGDILERLGVRPRQRSLKDALDEVEELKRRLARYESTEPK